MKKFKSFNDFETLSTYNFVGNSSSKKEKTKHGEKGLNGDDNINEIKSQQQERLQAISVRSPSTLDEVNSIIFSIQNNEPVIVDLTYKKSMLTQKVLNYLNGGIFALGGTINKLVDNMYIILPKGVQINLNN